MKQLMTWLTTGIVLTAMSVGVCQAQNADKAKTAEKPKKKVLMYSASYGFRHSCVTRPLDGGLSHAEKEFKKAAIAAGYEPYFTQDHNELKNGDQFNRFDAIVFYTTGSPPISRGSMHKWLKEGGAFIAIHCGSDTFYDWKEYGDFLGGYFKTHGPGIENGKHHPINLAVNRNDHPATCMLDKEWVIADELYHIKEYQKDRVDELIHVDLGALPDKIREHQKMKKDHHYPVSWTNTEEKGRIFYTSLGHREDVWSNPVYQKHLMGGIAWALGQDKPDTAKDSK